jgi:hypothetical protein
MLKRLTLKDVKKFAKKKGGECLSGEYWNIRQRLAWRCAKGHEWEASFQNVRQRPNWCPECSPSRRLTIGDMRRLAKRKGGECLSKEYVNTRQKMRWRCAEGHEWEATVAGIKYDGSWCPVCARVRSVITMKQRYGARKTVRRVVPKDDTSGIKDVYIDDNGQIIVM